MSSPSAGIRHPGGVGIPTALSVGIGAVLALLFFTVVQMLFGVLFPKNLAIDRPEPAARRERRSAAACTDERGPPPAWLAVGPPSVDDDAVEASPSHCMVDGFWVAWR